MSAVRKEVMADQDGWIWLDGQMLPWRDARVHVLIHALHYASAVFEGQRAYDGIIFKLSEHSARLRRSAAMLGLDVPWSVEEIDKACNEVLAANALTDAYMRPIAWCGADSMGLAPGGEAPHLAIAAWSWGKYFDARKMRTGLRLTISSWRRPPEYTAPSAAKASGLYMICSMAKRNATTAGFDDALMLDWRGRVAEATGANIFFVKDGTLHTPLPDCFLDGITRRTIIGLARRRGIEVVERAIWPEEMEAFQQAFLTGSAAEIVPVGSIGPWAFEAGAVTRQLARDYDDLVHGRITDAALADAA